jgi:hypothetical protein
MKADRNNHLLAHVLQDMVRDSGKGASKGDLSGAVMRGFLAEISEALAGVP